jgi:hypothetical protein
MIIIAMRIVIFIIIIVIIHHSMLDLPGIKFHCFFIYDIFFLSNISNYWFEKFT